MHKVQTQFSVLKAQKELREKRKLTYEVISGETGINPNTLTEYANNRVTRFDESVIARLCDYFNCDIGDLLVLQKY